MTKISNFTKKLSEKFKTLLNKFSRIRKYSLAITIVIVLLLVSTSGVFAFVSIKSFGAGNVFSQANSYIPTEQISALDALRPSDDVIIKRALASTLSFSNHEQGFGRISQTNIDLSIKRIANPNSDFPNSTQLQSNVLFKDKRDSDSPLVNQNYQIGGKFTSGVFTFDIGTNGVEIDMISDGWDTYYVKTSLSDQVKETYHSFFSRPMPPSDDEENQTQEDDSLGLLNLKLLDKYLFVNPYEYQVYADEIRLQYEALLTQGQVPAELLKSSLDASEIQSATKNLYQAVLPDLKLIGTKFVSTLLENATYSLQPREMVGDTNAVVYTVTLDKSKFSSAIVNGLDELILLPQKHQEVLKAYCESTTPADIYSRNCDESIYQFSDLNDQLDQESLAKMRNDLDNTLKDVYITDVKLFIDPYDNTLLKSQYTISFDETLSIDKENGHDTVTKFEMKVSTVTERGKNIDVAIPQDSLNYMEEMKKIQAKEMEAYQKLLEL